MILKKKKEPVQIIPRIYGGHATCIAESKEVFYVTHKKMYRLDIEQELWNCNYLLMKTDLGWPKQRETEWSQLSSNLS